MILKSFALLTAVLTAFAGMAVDDVTSHWEEYTDNEIHVAFRHPREWKPFPQYSDRTYFGGRDGEVQLSASDGDDLVKLCGNSRKAQCEAALSATP